MPSVAFRNQPGDSFIEEVTVGEREMPTGQNDERSLLGGWLATKIFHIHSLQGFFNLSTWLTAIVGAAILLLAYHLFTSQTSRSGRSGRFARR